MFRVLDKKLMLIPFIVLAFHIGILSIAMVLNYTVFGIIAILVSIVILILVYIYLHRWLVLSENRLIELSKDMAGARKYVVDNLPLGVIMLNDDEEIAWMNHYMCEQIPEDYHHEPINRVFPNIMTTLKANNIQSIDTSYGDRNYQVHYYDEHNSLLLLDITDEKNMEVALEDKDPVIGILFLDNYDDMTQNMTEALKSDLNNSLTNIINDWATENHVYLRRFSNDRFIMVMSAKSLSKIEETKFVLLDQVRESSDAHGAQITLSIGIGEGSSDYIEVGELAQSSLDLALGRGGDQVAIKTINGSARFYGGKTDPMEKRTRVKARVMAHALRDILLEGDNVIIMGHKNPDVDSIGSSIGVAKIASSNGIKANIILNDEDIDDTLSRLMKEVEAKEDLYNIFINSEDAWDMMSPKTTVVIVDTHRPSMVLDEDILNKATRKVVIDHHRRADDMISSPLLVYMEPYASSASELVAELLEYQNKQKKLSRIEATIMLTGIIAVSYKHL